MADALLARLMAPLAATLVNRVVLACNDLNTRRNKTTREEFGVAERDLLARITALERCERALREIVGQEKPNTWGYDAAHIALQDDWRERARKALRAVYE